jgi:mRNA interferase MazF
MVTLSPASIVIVPFPFSDLSATKLRPALVLAGTGHDDWLLCQITSKAYIDPHAIRLTDDSLSKGTLNTVSYARPMKLFTANADLIVKRVAILNDQAFRKVLTATIRTLQDNLPPEADEEE